MKLKDALPDIFKRPVPFVEEGTKILVAGTLLDTPKRDVLPIVRRAEIEKKKQIELLTNEPRTFLAFSGYSLIAKIIETEHFYKLLFQRCESASILVQPIREDNPELERVLDVLARGKFGWAFVDHGDGMCGVVTLSDLIPLYHTGVLHSELTFHDVASSNIFSMPRDATLKDALRELMKRRIRRVFLTGTNSYVSDREILRFIFSVERLALVRDSPSTMLEATLQDVGPVEPSEVVDGRATLSEVATLFGHSSGEPCATSGGELVTPWDLIVKPWKAGRLNLLETANIPCGQSKEGILK